MKLKSYAKINLTLDILGKRPDEYHEIKTVFQQIGLCDNIELKEIDKNIQIECNAKEIENQNNLACKAASLLKEKFGVRKGVKIKIEKNIPLGGGLSGGSSNAATVLSGLNKLWKLNIKKEKLIELSKEIGMDVAFHILGGTCLGKGRGEIITKIRDFPKHYIVLIYPGFSINAKEAYSALDLSKVGKKHSTKNFIKSFDLKFLHNDFEESLFRKYPKLAEIKASLGKNALLSGSGSCVFSLFESEEDAKSLLKNLQYEKVFITHTINSEI